MDKLVKMSILDYNVFRKKVKRIKYIHMIKTSY